MLGTRLGGLRGTLGIDLFFQGGKLVNTSTASHIRFAGRLVITTGCCGGSFLLLALTTLRTVGMPHTSPLAYPLQLEQAESP